MGDKFDEWLESWFNRHPRVWLWLDDHPAPLWLPIVIGTLSILTSLLSMYISAMRLM